MDIINYILLNLEKVGIGAFLFLCAYAANMGLGAWRNVHLNGHDFDWQLILNSLAKFVVVTCSVSLLTIVASAIPMYASYVAIEIEPTVCDTVSSLVIIGAFLVATIQYTKDAISKLQDILTNGATMSDVFVNDTQEGVVG